MTKIIKWLREQGIEFEYDDVCITIMLEPNCIWVNGFGKEMHYNKQIHIYKNNYNDYIVVEVTGYNMSHKLCWTTKQTSVINVLAYRFNKEV